MKKNRHFILIVLLFTLIVSPLSAENLVFAQTQKQSQDQAKFAEKIKRIERFVEEQMKSEGSVGLTVGFVKDNFTWVKGFGYADLENKILAKPESSYRLGSVSKPFTGVGIVKLIEQGKIDLDAEIQKYVPYFPKKKNPITIRQLLGHLSGISHYRNPDLEEHFKEHKNTREAIAVFENFDLVSEPGTRYVYTSYGYNLLAAAIEGASGKSYNEYMTENVWKPLGMNDTRLDDPLDIIPNRVQGYQLLNGKVKNAEYVDISSRLGGGGSRSTVPDLLKFAKGLYEGKLLTEKLRSDMWTAQYASDGRNIGYGYGWGTNTANGRFVVGHGGAQQGTRAYLLAAPNQKFAVAVAINFQNADSAAYVTKIFEIIMEEPWSIVYHGKNPVDSLMLNGMDSAFDFGMRYYDQFGKPLTNDETELKEAFAYFNELTKAAPEERYRKFARGNHLASKEAFVKMVSFMAEKLESEGKILHTYYRNGVLSLFYDYINFYKNRKDYSANFKFDSEFENRVTKWNLDWSKTWNDYTRNLEINPDTDLKEVDENLTKIFSGATILPDFVRQMDDQAKNQVVLKGNFKRAFEFAKLNEKLYPESHKSNATLGLLYILTGEENQGIPLLKKSIEIDRNGDASAATLNQVAYGILEMGIPEKGLRLLQIAAELHPKEANLYDSIADFYSRMGNKEKAIEFYQKVLEINPAAKDVKEKIDKLKTNN